MGEASRDYSLEESCWTNVFLTVSVLGWTHHVWILQQIQESGSSSGKPTDIYNKRLLTNQNKSGKLKTYKTYQKANFSMIDIYVRRLLKGQKPRANFLICIVSWSAVDLLVNPTQLLYISTTKWVLGSLFFFTSFPF